MNLPIGMLSLLSLLATSCAAVDAHPPVALTPPALTREFRGAWITCVATNADWPSQSGLPVAQQKAELVALLDHASELHLNTVILQVRPACDAMYASSIEPWSEYLTGTQGRGPEPAYDPLAFAVQEAHKRGMELHAWFNPFRAHHIFAKSPVAPNHVTRTHPDYVRQYGDQIWLDPGLPAAREYVLRVIMDVVKRYDIDGVQFDDYFYPYYDKAAGDFPDAATWRRYGNGGDRGDWRRENVNQFVHSVYTGIKAEKPWVKFGISPFGIWRPGNPPSVKGLDAYATLYADARTWLSNGWVDYLAPQLYWRVDAPEQNFSALLNWWAQQNPKKRNVLSALSAANVGERFPASEIDRQIRLTRAQAGAGGEIFFHLQDLVDDRELNRLVRIDNREPAVPPPMPWLNASAPEMPTAWGSPDTRGLSVHWSAPTNVVLKSWVVQSHGTNGQWTTQILSGAQKGCTFSSWTPDVVAVSAVDRFGNVSVPTVLTWEPGQTVPRGGGR